MVKKAHNMDSTQDIQKLVVSRRSKNINDVHDESITLGERIADAVADSVGSWRFIIFFLGALAIWILLNTVQIFFRPFDAYPYILLNLLLSCIAAIQAPLIMMSQNRQEDKDRLRAQYDYEINLKAEILVEEILKSLKRLETKQDSILKKFNEKELV